MRRTWKNFLSLLLVFSMILSLGATGFALDNEEPEVTAPAEETSEEVSGTGVELSFEKVDNDIISERLPFAHEEVEEEEPTYADDDIVRVSIVLNGASAIDAGYAPASAGAYRAGLRAEQEAMASKISAEVLGGAQLDVVWNLTLAANIISAYVEYDQIEAIRNVIGVKDVVIELRYYPTEDEVDNIIATEMTGATEAWNLGYTGAGSTIAIVDTGLDTDHQSFDPAGFQYAIDELNETRETPVRLMTNADIAAVWDQLNAAAFIDSADVTYLNEKVPYAVNYVDMDLDVTHDNDTQGEHGSHVAGIAAANKYIPNGEGFDKALETVNTQGEAPDAQLLIMKVFGKGGGAYDSDYMAAIEDAMTIGADSVNLSLGSSVAGYVENSTYAETLNKLTKFGMVWANSAGNNYSWSNDNSGPNKLYADDVNFQTGGSPATYHNSLSVASVDNTTGSISVPLVLSDGTKVTFSETSGYGNEPISTVSGEYPYIMLTRAGSEEEDFAALAEVLEGKVAVAWRGGSSFYVKANGGARNGAVATIIANNTAGVINMNLTGYEFTAPAVSIMQNDGLLMMELGEQKELNGVTYYEGTITIPEGVANTTKSEFQQMSDFSSWGGNGALTMKPEITAPGGNIWSVNGAVPGGKAYEYMSGTSMASPQIAGVNAVLKQYIREEGLQQKLGLTERAIAQSLLMSTAMPLREAATGNYWSIMKQGSGLVDVNSAITARSLIQVVALPEGAPASAYESIADGKVKVELGQTNGGFYTAFTATNFSDEDMSLYLNGEFFTQWIQGGEFRTEYTVPFNAHISWTVNGEQYAPGDLKLDFNNDGVANGVDAQTLLNWCADETTEIYNLQYADLDKDGNVDTADAKIAFETLNGIAVNLAAGETALIEAAVGYDLSSYDAFNGTYVEGFLFVQEGDTNDGALGIKHSIPVFGFNGNFSEATMFDRGSRLEYMYEFGDGDPDTGVLPYMYYAATSAGGLGEAALTQETFLVKYAGDSGSYYFGGNPLLDDETYHPERNALNAKDMLAGVRFSQIRNAGASRFFVTDKYDRVVTGTEMEGGPSYAAYYYRNQATWQGVSSTVGFNYVPRHVQEGDELTAHYQLALEYFVNEDGSVRWDELGEGSELTIPFVIDNTAPDIVKVYRDTVEAPDPDEDETPVAPAAVTNDEEEMPITDDPVEEEEPAAPASDTLEIITHDNQYIAAVALFTDEGELLGAMGAVEDTIRGKEVYYSFDLQEIFGEEEVYPYLLVQVYDYASNLSTYKVNFKDDLENAEVESVTLNMNEATIIGTGSIRLSADVRPWGIDDAITWSSDNEAVATVDGNGLVTGVTEGTAVITAASALDPTKFDTCEVTVKFIEKELNGIVWDENGEVWFSEFNLKSLPDYTPLHESSMRLPLASATYDGAGNLYAATIDSSSMASTLYKVNESDWTVEAIGPESSIGFVDICAAPNVGADRLMGVYGTYIVLIDKTTGQFVTAFRSNAEANLVGIAYEGVLDYTAYGYGLIDMYLAVDAKGNLYEGGILNQDTMPGYALTPSKMGNLGFTTDQNCYQSLYYDGINVFWSCFNMSTNKVDMIMVDDLWNDGSIYQAGSFADGVWPVGGLFESSFDTGTLVYESIQPASPDRITDNDFMSTIPGLDGPEAEIVEEEPAEEPVEEPAPPEEPVEEPAPADEPGEGIIVGGGLDFARIEIPSAEIEKISTEVVVYITADMLTYNGKIEVNFDPDTVKLLEAVPSTQYNGILNRSKDLGRYVLAWVDLEGIETDGTILTLKFDAESVGTVSIITHEENFKDADLEKSGLPREELIFLGSSQIPEDHEHSFELVRWTWNEDLSSAIAVFACPQDGVSKSIEATVTSETTDPTCTETGKTVYTATVEFEGETYTDTKEVEIEALGHKYGEPTWTWTEDFAATAVFTCERCGDKQEVEAAVTSEITTEPTCEETGVKTYTATAAFEGETYTATTTETLPATGHDWDEPTWTWEGTESAEAAFVCKNDAEHTTTVKAEITVAVADGTVTYTATVELDGKTYTDTKTAEVAGEVYGKTLVIGEKFSAKTYLKLSDTILADKGAYVEVNGNKILVTDATKLKSGKTILYGFDFNLGPKMFNDEINVKLFNGNGEQVILVSYDQNILPDGFTFKAQDYIDSTIATSTNTKLVDTMKALSDLGHYAQVYYKYNTENLAELYGVSADVTVDDVANCAGVVVTENKDVLTYNGSSMLLQSEIKIRQYFTLAADVDASTLTFKLNGETVTPGQRSGMYYIETKNVPAKSFDVPYTFTIEDAEGNVVYEGQYSAFSYILASMNNPKSEAKLIDLVKAMVAYNQNAKAYFG